MSVGAGGAPAIPSPGFPDPARDAQRAFRALLDAMAHPARRRPLTCPPAAPPGLGPGLAAVALTLLDEDCTVWLGTPFGDDPEVAPWLAFHTGVRRTPDAAAAQFVIATPRSLPRLDSLAPGSDEAPHLSATVVLDVRGCAGPARFTARGPGIDGAITLKAPWAAGAFLERWHSNSDRFPRGVDLLLVGERDVTALPRTTRLTVAERED